VVRINDRGPFGRARRIIDLSYGAAKALGVSGTAKVDMIVLR
jgi:rare lipoprotein A